MQAFRVCVCVGVCVRVCERARRRVSASTHTHIHTHGATHTNTLSLTSLTWIAKHESIKREDVSDRRGERSLCLERRRMEAVKTTELSRERSSSSRL